MSPKHPGNRPAGTKATLPSLPKSTPLVAIGAMSAALSMSACKTSDTSTSGAKDFAAPLAPPTFNFTTCGRASNTTICLADDNSTMQISNPVGQTQFAVTGTAASTTLAGATSYFGVANLSFIAGFNAGTQIAFVVQADSNQGKLMYLTAAGWTAWPNSGVFNLFNPADNNIPPLAPPQAVPPLAAQPLAPPQAVPPLAAQPPQAVPPLAPGTGRGTPVPPLAAGFGQPPQAVPPLAAQPPQAVPPLAPGTGNSDSPAGD